MIAKHLRCLLASSAGIAILSLSACSSEAPAADAAVGKPDAAIVDGALPGGDTALAADVSTTKKSSGGSGGKLGDSTQQLQHEGKTRKFAVHVAKGYQESVPAPLVLHFHGWRPLPAGIESEIAYVWAKEADARGFIAAAPEGVSCPELNPKGDPYGCFKSVAFVAALVDDLGKKYNLDLTRIYLSGHSGGGYFVQLAGISGADKYAAVVGFSGGCISSGNNYINSCSRYKTASDAASRKVPYFVVHGSKDQVVPVSYSADLIKIVLAANKHPHTVYPSKASDVYDGGKYGHSVDVSVVPQVWTWLAQYTTP